MVTMSDVAKAAGVSKMTVSNVVNGHPNVRHETRALVLAAIDRLGYRMNIAARSLRAGRTGMIGLAVPEINRPYYGHLAEVLIERFAQHGLRVVVEQTGASREGELDAVFYSRLRMYDGLVLSAVGLGEADVDLLRLDFPVVVIGERIHDATIDHVVMANVAGARAATRHLLEVGCTRVAIIGGSRADAPSASSLRSDGYREALTEAGLPVAPELDVPVDLTMEAGARAMHDLVAAGVAFDGVFCLTDTVAIGVLRGLADLGRSVPEDVKVIGFDDVPLAGFTVPALSSIDPGTPEMAEAVVRILMARIRGDEIAPQEFVGPHRVVVRGSSAG